MAKNKSAIIDSLDKFTKAYIECALWSSTDESREDGGDPIDDNYDINDLTIKALRDIRRECRDFQAANKKLLDQVEALHPTGRWTYQEQNGHDFWLTRNGHGAGFWDRGYGELGETLSEKAKEYGESYIQVYRGKLHVS